MCLHRAGNLISTFPEGECLVTSVKHFRQAETSLPNQQALTPSKHSLTESLFLQTISEFLSQSVMMRLRGGYPYTQNSPWCLKRLFKKDLKDYVHSKKEGKQWIQALNGLERTNLMSNILQVSKQTGQGRL